MFRRLSLLLLLTSAAAPAAQAQSSISPSATPAAAAPAQYGIAYTYPLLSGGYELAFQDGVTPNPRFKRYEEGGHDKVFADEAAALNFLAAQGWGVLPYGAENSNHYLLKRRAR